MILSTTARDPEVSQRKIARALADLIPNSKYVPRGEKTIKRMVEICRKLGYRRLIIVNKKPAVVKAIKVSGNSWEWHDKVINTKDIKIGNINPDYLRCSDSFLTDFFDVKSDVSKYELVYDNELKVIKNE